MNKLYPTLFILLICYSARAEGVRLLCRPLPDSIMLRWAPTDKPTWSLGNTYGYVVERYTLLRNGKLLNNIERTMLTPVPLRPAPLDKWEPHAEDKYAAIAAECIYGGATVAAPLSSPVAIGKRYREEQNRFSFALYAADQSPLVARLSGLSLTDKSARPNEKYLYRVYIAQPDSFPKLDTASAFTGISEYQALPAPLGLKAQWRNRQVLLSWNTLYLGRIYSSYIIEKSTDSVHFASLSDKATIQLSDDNVSPTLAYQTDSLPDNQTSFYYRLRGINAFGELGPPCKAVAGHGRIPITQPPVIINSEVLNNSRVALTWSYPMDMNPYIKGFNLYRSSSPKGVKRKISTVKNAATRTFTDSTPNNGNYYTISVADGEQELLSPALTYAELVDSIPPLAPRNLMGTIDSLGMVYLRWKESPESDMDGYRVYRANRSDVEFTLISPALVHDTTFTDRVNIKTLTRKVYYKISAVDLRQNQSVLSQMLTIERPDVIPPVAPRLQSVEEHKGVTALAWVNSTSTDATKHYIYRKEKADTAFQLLVGVEKSQGNYGTYEDKTVKPGGVYTYYLQAEDASGLRSPFSILLTRSVASNEVESVLLKAYSYSGKAKLQWVVKSPKKVTRVVIYRSVNNAPMQVYSNTTEGSFVDENLGMEGKYNYCVKAIYEDESVSVLSNEVSVKK